MNTLANKSAGASRLVEARQSLKQQLKRKANQKAGDRFAQDASTKRGESGQDYIKRLKVMELSRRASTKKIMEMKQRRAELPRPESSALAADEEKIDDGEEEDAD